MSTRRLVAIASAGLAGAALIAFGVWGLTSGAPSPHEATIPVETITTSVDAPGETLPDDACRDYRVADDAPRVITLPSIGSSGCVVRVGIDQHDSIAVPTNVHLAGWYVDSPVPGENGVSIIDGHVRGEQSVGIFGRLGELATGDIIDVEFGDASVTSFRVVSVDTFSTARTATEQFRPLPGVDAQLTLITCAGRYDPAIGTHDLRVVVRAELI